jgi:hypothetical protein
MAAARKGGLLAILGDPKPSGEDAEEAEYGDSEQRVEDAQALLDAISSGDATAVADAFSALKKSCDAGESDDMV